MEISPLSDRSVAEEEEQAFVGSPSRRKKRSLSARRVVLRPWAVGGHRRQRDLVARSRNSRHHRARHEHLGLDQAQDPGLGPVSLCGVWRQGDGAPRGYRCAGHVRRTGSHIDELVTEVIAGRLGQPDALAKHQMSGGVSETSGISAAVAEQRGRILRAQRDYDVEVVERCDLKRIREPAEVRIAELEAERLLRDRGGALAPILGTEDAAAAFREAPLEVRRQVIDTLVTVTLHAQPLNCAPGLRSC